MKRLGYFAITLLFAISLSAAVFAEEGENDKDKQCYSQSLVSQQLGQLSCDDSKDKKDKDQE